MPVLVNEYKKIQFLVDNLVLPFLKSQHPKWRDLILAYLEYLDDNPLFYALNITDNVNVNEMFSELLDDFLNLYFKDVVDLNKFGLNDDNKRLFIALSKLIHNLKANKSSFGFFFNSFTNFSIPTDSGDIDIGALTVELREKPEWWFINNDPTRPYTYIFKVNEVDLTNIRELIAEVHPAGFLYLFLYEIHFEEHLRAYECIELTTRYGIFYNGKYNYDGIQMIDGVPEPLLYQGEFRVEDYLCDEAPQGSPIPNYFVQQGDIEIEIVSDVGRQITPASQADIEFVTQSDIELPPTQAFFDLWLLKEETTQNWVFSNTTNPPTSTSNFPYDSGDPVAPIPPSWPSGIYDLRSFDFYDYASGAVNINGVFESFKITNIEFLNGAVWESKFDNTHWSAFDGSWNGSEWVPALFAGFWWHLGLIRTGSWYLGYRPTQCRISFTRP